MFIIIVNLMEDILDYENTLHYNNKINQIIWGYSQIFNIFGYLLKDKIGLKNSDMIVDIQRGLVDNNNQIFWDYFGATHNIIGEIPHISGGINLESVCRCIRFTFSSGKSLTISTNSHPNRIPEGIISLDSFYLGLKDFEREIFDKILLGINKAESEYFRSESYRSAIQGIRTLSKDEIFRILNVVKDSLN